MIDALRERLDGVGSRTELERFVAGLDEGEPVAAALALAARSWLGQPGLVPDDSFDVRTVLSEDWSSTMLGAYPVIFMGSNEWATKPYLGVEHHRAKLTRVAEHLRRTLDTMRGGRVVLIVVPEKDYVVDRLFLKTGRFAAIDQAFAEFGASCEAMGAPLIFDGYLDPLRAYLTPADFEYADSHLHWRCYHQIFALALQQLGHRWAELEPSFNVEEATVVGDLQAKFGGGPTPSVSRHLARRGAAVTLVAGTPSFANPLGDTWQFLVSERPLLPGRVRLLGDSHSSIFDKRNLTSLFASTFSSCEFHWNPFAIRSKPEPSDCEVTVMEIAQRFLL